MRLGRPEAPSGSWSPPSSPARKLKPPSRMAAPHFFYHPIFPVALGTVMKTKVLLLTGSTGMTEADHRVDVPF